MVGIGASQSVVISWSARYFYFLFVCCMKEPFSCGWQGDERGWNSCVKAKIVRKEGGEQPSVMTSLLRSSDLSIFHR